jgi:hypothetical protein
MDQGTGKSSNDASKNKMTKVSEYLFYEKSVHITLLVYLLLYEKYNLLL